MSVRRLAPGSLTGALLPGGLAVLAAAAVVHLPASSGPLLAFLRAYPYLLPVAGALLAASFRRGRVLLALAALSLSVMAFREPGGGAHAEEFARYLYAAVAFLLPVNLGLLGLLAERGVLSGRGVLRLTLIAFQPLTVVLAWLAYLPRVTAAFEAPLLGPHITWLGPLPQPALVAFSAAALTLLVATVLRRGAVEGSLFWALAASWLGLLAWPERATILAFLAAASLALIAGLVVSVTRAAYRDPLTGLPGRRALDEALPALGERFAVAMVDIDHFKEVNDSWGHGVGDEVLRMVAAHLGGVGGAGKAFRYGGEEFALLFAGRGIADVTPHLEELRRAIEGARFTLRAPGRPAQKPQSPQRGKADHPELAVTVSIGLAERRGDGASPLAVLRAADAALYRAKAAGRNRLCADATHPRQPRT